MAQPVNADPVGRIWDRTVSTGQFVLATMVLAVGLIGAFVQGRIQAAVADERISALTQAQTRMQTQLDTIQQQGNVINNSIGQIQGQLQALNFALTHVTDEKPPKGR